MQLKLNKIQMIVKSLEMMKKEIQKEKEKESLNTSFMYKEHEIEESIHELLLLEMWLKNGNNINIKF